MLERGQQQHRWIKSSKEARVGEPATCCATRSRWLACMLRSSSSDAAIRWSNSARTRCPFEASSRFSTSVRGSHVCGWRWCGCLFPKYAGIIIGLSVGLQKSRIAGIRNGSDSNQTSLCLHGLLSNYDTLETITERGIECISPSAYN